MVRDLEEVVGDWDVGWRRTREDLGAWDGGLRFRR